MVYRSRYAARAVDERPMGDWIMEAMAGHGHQIAFIDGVTGAETTYAQLYSWIRSVETGLHQAGLRAGDVGAVILPNCPEYGVIFVALACRGGVISGVNPVYTHDEIVRHLKDCEARYVFTDMGHLDLVRAAVAAVPRVETVFVVCSGSESERLPSSVRPFFSLRVPATRLPPVTLNSRTATTALLYSSGTTGVPKGVMLTHYDLSAASAALDVPEFPFHVKGERELCFLPFFHIFGLTIIMLEGLRRGVTLITMPKFTPQLFLRLLQDHKIGTLICVPPILVLLVKAPVVGQYDLSHLRKLFVGAAPAGKDLITDFMTKFPQVKFFCQGYGMTECTGASIVSPAIQESQMHLGSCGILCPSFEGMIVDPETGKEVTEAGKRGEVWMRSPSLMTGYLHRPDATAETIDKNGWLHTGDIGYVDKDGYWYVVDRIKELIKVKGFQVAPAELEDLLLSCPGVADSAVIGIPDAQAGELPRAFIVKHATANITENDVINFVKGKVAPFKELKGGVKFVTELPKSPSGKILRRILRNAEQSKI